MRRFSEKQIQFLEAYLSGLPMTVAVALAGYAASSPQSRCNRGKAILTKFLANPKALFRLAGARERKIARLLVNMADNGKPERQLIALKILFEVLK